MLQIGHIISKKYLLDTRDIWDNTFAIRIPGRTTGAIRLSDDNVIVECVVSDERYPKDTNEILEQYIGETLDIK